MAEWGLLWMLLIRRRPHRCHLAVPILMGWSVITPDLRIALWRPLLVRCVIASTSRADRGRSARQTEEGHRFLVIPRWRRLPEVPLFRLDFRWRPRQRRAPVLTPGKNSYPRKGMLCNFSRRPFRAVPGDVAAEKCKMGRTANMA